MQELGITSKIGLKYAKKGSDHHKLWDILEIIYLAITDELLLPFVRHSLKKMSQFCSQLKTTGNIARTPPIKRTHIICQICLKYKTNCIKHDFGIG